MSKKDYERVAFAFRVEREHGNGALSEPACLIVRTALVNVARDLASAFKADNPRFDRDRFLAACGIDARELTGLR